MLSHRIQSLQVRWDGPYWCKLLQVDPGCGWGKGWPEKVEVTKGPWSWWLVPSSSLQPPTPTLSPAFLPRKDSSSPRKVSSWYLFISCHIYDWYRRFYCPNFFTHQLSKCESHDQIANHPWHQNAKSILSITVSMSRIALSLLVHEKVQAWCNYR